MNVPAVLLETKMRRSFLIKGICMEGNYASVSGSSRGAEQLFYRNPTLYSVQERGTAPIHLGPFPKGVLFSLAGRFSVL